MKKFEVDFTKEIESLGRHDAMMGKKNLLSLVRLIYIHKFNAKSYAPWFYAGENNDNYFNYRSFQTSDWF